MVEMIKFTTSGEPIDPVAQNVMRKIAVLHLAEAIALCYRTDVGGTKHFLFKHYLASVFAMLPFYECFMSEITVMGPSIKHVNV